MPMRGGAWVLCDHVIEQSGVSWITTTPRSCCCNCREVTPRSGLDGLASGRRCHGGRLHAHRDTARLRRRQLGHANRKHTEVILSLDGLQVGALGQPELAHELALRGFTDQLALALSQFAADPLAAHRQHAIFRQHLKTFGWNAGHVERDGEALLILAGMHGGLPGCGRAAGKDLFEEAVHLAANGVDGSDRDRGNSVVGHGILRRVVDRDDL